MNAARDPAEARRSFDAGLAAARTGRPAEAMTLLERAADLGSTEALMVMADIFLHGAGDLQPEAPRAVACLARAADSGVASAALGLASIHYAAFGVPADDMAAAAWLRRALEAGHRPALRMLGLMLWLHGPARRAAALAVLRHAARAGDPFAQHAVGVIALTSPDAAARTQGARWLGAAAAAGLAASALRLRTLGEPGVPGTVPPAAADEAAADAAAVAAEIAAMDRYWPPVAAAADLPERQEARLVWTRRGLLDPLLCDYLITTAAPWLERSMTTDPVSGEPVPDNARTSWGMNFTRAFPDLGVAYAERRIADCAGLPLATAEPLAVLRYEVGQEYKPHHDFMQPQALTSSAYYRRVGQRVLSVVTYLNAPRGGGGTVFPRLDLKFEAEVGTGVKFRNVDDAGRPEEDSLHAGLPVTAGEKWVCTLWFRERTVRTA